MNFPRAFWPEKDGSSDSIRTRGTSKPPVAIPLYEAMIQQLAKEMGKPIQTGQFGADMKVALVNDGPVTIIIDSKNKE